MPNTFSGLATEIFETEFLSNTGIASFSQISGWLSVNLGGLNNLLNTSFSGADPIIDQEAAAIFKNQYMASYYGRQASNAAVGVLTSSAGENILSVSDGDNKISFVNRNEVAKNFRSIKKDIEEQIDKAAAKYCLFLSGPQSVDSFDGGECLPVSEERY